VQLNGLLQQLIVTVNGANQGI